MCLPQLPACAGGAAEKAIMNTYRLLNLRSGHGPHDLRDHLPGSGKIYSVDPDVVERFKSITAERDAEAERRRQALAIRSQAHKKKRRRKPAQKRPFPPKERKPMTLDTSLYPADVVEAAKREMAKKPTGRRLKKVFTADVAAVWYEQLKAGKSVVWLTKNNGLVPTSSATINEVLNRFPPQPKATRPKPKPVRMPEPESPNLNDKPTVEDDIPLPPAAPESAPVIESARPFTPDMLPAFLRRNHLSTAQVVPRPAAGLDTLVELLRDEHVEVEGEVHLNLTIRVNKQNKKE